MRTIMRAIVGGYIGLAAVLAPVAALAEYSYEGSDYSNDYPEPAYGGYDVMYTCDMEADSRHVYAQYQLNTGEWSDVTDGNGAFNNCGHRGPYTYIIQHRTCEAIDFWPDSCGSYVYPD